MNSPNSMLLGGSALATVGAALLAGADHHAVAVALGLVAVTLLFAAVRSSPTPTKPAAAAAADAADAKSDAKPVSHGHSHDGAACHGHGDSTAATAAAATPPPPVEEKKKENETKFLRILYGTMTNRSKGLATQLGMLAKRIPGWEVDVSDIALYDQDNLEQEDHVVFILSSWTGGTPPETCLVFFQWLRDFCNDFRVSRAHLAHVKVSVLGLGNSEYDEDYCGAAVELQELLVGVGAKLLLPLAKADDNADVDAQFGVWAGNFLNTLQGDEEKKPLKVAGAAAAPAPKGKFDPTKGGDRSRAPVDGTRAARRERETAAVEWTEEDRINDQMLTQDQLGNEQDQKDGEESEEENGGGTMAMIGDLEDLGAALMASKSREMVTPAQRKALTKEGYKIIGTHSAVKLCRWTKHQLRGRGGCYKHTMYGIASYQCMEATPSLACANKCVFCWRHHKNPVGREWRWKTDEPGFIVDEAVTKHQRMIKELRGMPGLMMERWHEAFTVKHCALSLVGEPIMYPKINDMCDQLHHRGISTFLVTNAQFPDAIRQLTPVTQLYVSIDAGNKDDLKAIDRPLFKDFWERFMESLKALKEKGQRTVYRMTLVKEWNMSDEDDDREFQEFVDLIKMGEPDFIEIKAVTYCGKSDASTLTIKNSPWHHEVRKFAAELCKRTDGAYGTACEHAHSCCTLLAKEEFRVDGQWRTWIDYPKFHELVKEFKESNGEKTFSAKDYMADTPDWAVWGAPEQGFDPIETRFYRTKTGGVKKLEYSATESGCG